MTRLHGFTLLVLAVGTLFVAGCGSSSSPTATNTAGTSGSGSTATQLVGQAAATSQSTFHVGDAQTVRVNGDEVSATLVKLYDTVNNPIFTEFNGLSMPSDLDNSTHYVGVEMSFTNLSQNPETIGLVQISTPLEPTFDATGQLSSGGADETSNNYVKGFDGCTSNATADDLAPGASETFCVALKVPNGIQVVEIDWNSVDTTNGEAYWAVP